MNDSNDGEAWAEHYARAVGRITLLFDDVDEFAAIPATPSWCARDLLAHLVGVAADVTAGNVGAYAQGAWTRAQVADRAGRSRDRLESEWAELMGPMQEVLRDPVAHDLDPSFSYLPVIDALAHEHDLREANGVLGFSDDGVWSAVAQRRRDVLTLQHAMAGLPPLEVRTDDGVSWTIGDGPCEAVVTAPRYELWRSLEGRRTRATVAAFDWSVDPEVFLDHWVAFVFDWVPEH